MKLDTFFFSVELHLFGYFAYTKYYINTACFAYKCIAFCVFLNYIYLKINHKHY